MYTLCNYPGLKVSKFQNKMAFTFTNYGNIDRKYENKKHIYLGTEGLGLNGGISRYRTQSIICHKHSLIVRREKAQPNRCSKSVNLRIDKRIDHSYLLFTKLYGKVCAACLRVIECFVFGFDQL